MTESTSNPPISAQIAYLKEALVLHVLDVCDIIQWADEQINRQENPSWELIELALMGNSNRFDTASQLLRVASPSISSAETLPYVLAAAHRKLLGAPDFARVLAEGMYRVWIEADGTFPDALGPCGYFDDAYSLAETGTYGRIEQIDQELLEFTAGFSELVFSENINPLIENTPQ